MPPKDTYPSVSVRGPQATSFYSVEAIDNGQIAGSSKWVKLITCTVDLETPGCLDDDTAVELAIDSLTVDNADKVQLKKALAKEIPGKDERDALAAKAKEQVNKFLFE